VLKRKVLGPTKVVLRCDPALSPTMDYHAYSAAHFAAEKLVLRDGERATVWTIEPLTFRQRALVDRFEGRNRKSAIVQCGLRGVEGYYVEAQSGQDAELRQPERHTVGELGHIVTDEWMAEANLLDDELAQLSDAIWEISEARPFSSTR